MIFDVDLIIIEAMWLEDKIKTEVETHDARHFNEYESVYIKGEEFLVKIESELDLEEYRDNEYPLSTQTIQDHATVLPSKYKSREKLWCCSELCRVIERIKSKMVVLRTTREMKDELARAIANLTRKKTLVHQASFMSYTEGGEFDENDTSPIRMKKGGILVTRYTYFIVTDDEAALNAFSAMFPVETSGT